MPDPYFSAALKGTTYDTYEEDVALVTIYFDSPTMFAYKKSKRMTL